MVLVSYPADLRPRLGDMCHWQGLDPDPNVVELAGEVGGFGKGTWGWCGSGRHGAAGLQA